MTPAELTNLIVSQVKPLFPDVKTVTVYVDTKTCFYGFTGKVEPTKYEVWISPDYPAEDPRSREKAILIKAPTVNKILSQIQNHILKNKRGIHLELEEPTNQEQA